MNVFKRIFQQIRDINGVKECKYKILKTTLFHYKQLICEKMSFIVILMLFAYYFLFKRITNILLWKINSI